MAQLMYQHCQRSFLDAIIKSDLRWQIPGSFKVRSQPNTIFEECAQHLEFTTTIPLLKHKVYLMPLISLNCLPRTCTHYCTAILDFDAQAPSWATTRCPLEPTTGPGTGGRPQVAGGSSRSGFGPEMGQTNYPTDYLVDTFISWWIIHRWKKLT